MLNTTVIIVTYSNRFHLLKRVIETCFKERVSKVVVVDNNSENESKVLLQNFQTKYSPNLHVIWNTVNEGSAKAFKIGLKYVFQKSEHEYIWLLDDDNEPEEGALENIHSYWVRKDNETACLLSYRPDRYQYKTAILSENPNLVLSKPNSFYGFSLMEKLKKPFKKRESLNSKITSGRIAYAPYGGMFFHKSLINDIGFPDEEFYLYSDDHDWSYRITKMSKKIILLLNSKVRDIDKSWSVNSTSQTVFQTISKGSRFRIYYTIRNRMIFEKRYLTKNSAVYSINLAIFTFILFFNCGLSQNFKIFLLAIKHAKTNNLGKTFEGSLN
ncbi:glycosyltransferase [Mangrovimonas sp. ST2L15]|uniref:glycosyltransferase n=1 Tax=Mangrovimonas sp. ST2L15 TaxID=1645916 RepID=UPI0006B5C4FB|nr:glycosyltransferase [Mangrovimonas sp. ST2L15]